MILTKSGRRMFPLVQVQLTNLDPSKFYYVLLDIVLVDQMRYKFMNLQWVPSLKTNFQSEINFYNHSKSPALGSKWMQEPITFTGVKLSNYEKSDETRIILRSMHKYRVRIHVVQCSDITQLYYSNFHTFDFPQTTFIAVTSYQNEKLADLKIEKNPYARAFKIGSKRRSENESTKANSSENISPSNKGVVAMTSGNTEMEPEYQNAFASFPSPSNSIPLGYPNYPFHSMPCAFNRYSPCNYLQPANRSFNPWSYQASIHPQPFLSHCSCLNCSPLRYNNVSSTASTQLSCCESCSICNSAVSSTVTENKKTQ
ncbi:T-box transcription factor mls-1-like [Stegodyphus dumicola]|uniref:T-box transcription factor mls-1-like n=1 Tax=Stegodyphus dumicola TaxID=202533 RepID=UPI0015A9D059|nr:T-box transcription factor mls-1-like [Stegodyphus dumicola]